MDWQQRYANKVSTAGAAIRQLAAGRRILIGSGAAEPTLLVDALVQHGEHLADNEVVHLLTLGPAPYVAAGLEHRFRHAAFFIGPNTRQAVQDGRADFIPVFLSDIPALIRSRRIRIDAVLIQVSPPDRHGYVSLGVSVDIVRAAVDAAGLVIAEVNANMPRTLGDSLLEMARIDCAVPSDAPLLELPQHPLDEASRQLGLHVASLVPDGATIQTGIGRIPHAIMEALRERRDLGIHTEMLSDSTMELAQQGVINGRKKTLLNGKIVTSFVMGTRRLYEWVHDNPVVEMRPTEFVNDPFTIARHENMVAINAALAVDLTGQVAADTISGRFFSGIGGQVDFIRGAARSRGGKPIIALPSTAKRGSVSRIRATLDEGAGVVTSRGDVHYVVTEYGIADLWGKTVRQRAMALIEIAHPDHRPELLARAKARRYVFANQMSPRAVCPHTVSRFRAANVELELRPLRMSDEGTLQDMFYRLSDNSIYQRFLQFRRRHPHDEMQKLVDLDYDASMALVVSLCEAPHEIVAMARYDVDPATAFADIAFVVRDDWQRRGLGSLLLGQMIELARARGLSGFTADVLATNSGMLRVFQKSGYDVTTRLDSGVYEVRLSFLRDESSALTSAASAKPARLV